MKKDNRIALGTGGAMGIGKAAVCRLAEDEFTVIIADREVKVIKYTLYLYSL